MIRKDTKIKKFFIRRKGVGIQCILKEFCKFCFVVTSELSGEPFLSWFYHKLCTHIFLHLQWENPGGFIFENSPHVCRRCRQQSMRKCIYLFSECCFIVCSHQSCHLSPRFKLSIVSPILLPCTESAFWYFLTKYVIASPRCAQPFKRKFARIEKKFGSFLHHRLLVVCVVRAHSSLLER